MQLPVSIYFQKNSQIDLEKKQNRITKSYSFHRNNKNKNTIIFLYQIYSNLVNIAKQLNHMYLCLALLKGSRNEDQRPDLGLLKSSLGGLRFRLEAAPACWAAGDAGEGLLTAKMGAGVDGGFIRNAGALS